MRLAGGNVVMVARMCRASAGACVCSCVHAMASMLMPLHMSCLALIHAPIPKAMPLPCDLQLRASMAWNMEGLCEECIGVVSVAGGMWEEQRRMNVPLWTSEWLKGSEDDKNTYT